MVRADALVGRPVVAAGTGEKLGEVADTLVTASAGTVAGFVIGGGWHAPERVLRRADVATLGRDVVVAAPGARLIEPKEWRELDVDAQRVASYRHKPVVTRAGEKIGAVDTLYLDEQSPAIYGYDIAESGFAGLVQRHTMLPHSQDVVVGPDVIVVQERPAASAPDAGARPRTA